MNVKKMEAKALIEKRIASLKSEKAEVLKEYPKAGDLQDVLAERNMRISLELKFLDELSKQVK